MALSGGRQALLPQDNFFYPICTYAFRGWRAWGPPENVTPTFRVPNKAEIKGFLLRYRLFLYYQWFFQNIEKRWRKIFEKDYFRDFLKNDEIYKKKSSSLFQYCEITFASTETNDTSAESP